MYIHYIYISTNTHTNIYIYTIILDKTVTRGCSDRVTAPNGDLYFVGKRTCNYYYMWTSLVSFLSSPAPAVPPQSATIPPINYVWNPARWRRSGHTRSGNDHFLCGDLSHGRSRSSISAARRRREPRACSVVRVGTWRVWCRARASYNTAAIILLLLYGCLFKGDPPPPSSDIH